MTTKNAAGLACALTLMLAAACGNDSSTADAGVQPIDAHESIDAASADADPLTLSDLCAQDGAFVAYYHVVIECYPDVPIELGYIPTDAELSDWCAGLFGPFYDEGTLVVADAATIAQCLAELEAIDCNDVGLERPSGSCADIVAGTIAQGGDCESELQCAGDAYCDFGDTASCGTCQPRAADGQPCDDGGACTGGVCAAQLCLTPGADGAPCSAGEHCRGRRRCNFETSTCASPPLAGDGCGSDDDCWTPHTALFCDTSSSSCAAYADLGDSCGPAAQCSLLDYETCGASQLCESPVTRGENQSCGMVAGQQCEAGLYCDDPIDGGVCVGLPVAGDACQSGSDCGALLRCYEQQCVYQDYAGSCAAP